METDVIQSVLGSFDFARIFFRGVTHGRNIRMPIKRVIIEIELGVERQHLAAGGNDKWIDLHHRAVEPDKGLIQTVE